MFRRRLRSNGNAGSCGAGRVTSPAVAGPDIGILTREFVSVTAATRAIANAGVWRQGDDEGFGWLDDRPLVIGHSDESWVVDDQPSFRALCGLLGWEPCSRELAIGAMCNDAIDHRKLALAALAVLEVYEGVIDYGDSLEAEPPDLPGWTVHLRYEAAAGGYGQTAIVSSDWLRGWLSAPQFRLVK